MIKDKGAAVLYYNIERETSMFSKLEHLENVSIEDKTLRGVWENILTIDDLHLIDLILKYRKIIEKPTYSRKKIEK